jgi:hydrogenase maturation factor HypF (carbamoyltransferase family)
MELCPHCHEWYDDDNDTQPCCPGCGYPYTFMDGEGNLILADDVLIPDLDAELEGEDPL